MTREEYLKSYHEKRKQLNLLETELRVMKLEFIEEHKQIKGALPVKIHFVYNEQSFMGEVTQKEADAYIIGYDVIVPYYVSPLDSQPEAEFYGKVFPILMSAKKNGEMSERHLHFHKIGTVRFWEIGKEDTIYEINFGE